MGEVRGEHTLTEQHAHYLAGTLSEKSRGLACGIVEQERKTERERDRERICFSKQRGRNWCLPLDNCCPPENSRLYTEFSVNRIEQ